MDFAEVSGSRSRRGLGDARLWLRAGPRLLGIEEGGLPVWLGLRAGVKVPGSEFPIESRIIPLTEGQTDFELALEAGRAFAQRRFVLQGWGGYRWRRENRKAGARPGNEWFGYLAGSTSVPGATLRVAAQVLRGGDYEIIGIQLPTSRRKMFEILPSVSVRVGPGQLEVGTRLAIAGRNLPTGTAFTAGYSLSWGGTPSVHLEDLFPER